MSKRDPADPDPKAFRKAMKDLTDAGRPDVASRAATALTKVGPEDEVRSDPEAPKDPGRPRKPKTAEDI
jgi:hypothetical protein